MSFIWTYFWDIKWIFLVLLFILFSFFFELKSSSLNSICLMLFLFVLISTDLILFNFDSLLNNQNNLVIFLLSFIMLFVSIYFWQIFFSKLNQKMEFSTLVLLIFVLGFFIFKSENMLELFLVIEGLSFSAYILAGFEKDTKIASSVGIQYLILGSISSIFLMIAFLLVYNQFGSGVFINLFLANLDFLQDYFNINENVALESFIIDGSFKEESIYLSLSLMGGFYFNHIKNFFNFIYYTIKNSIISVIVLNIFCPNLVKEFILKADDFCYLSKKDFYDISIICDPIGIPNANGFNLDISDRYTALTGITGSQADLIAREEKKQIETLLRTLFKDLQKEAEIKGEKYDREVFFQEIEKLRECPVLPDRWRFYNDGIFNWKAIADKLRVRIQNKTLDDNSLIKDTAHEAYLIRQGQLAHNLNISDYPIAIFDKKKGKYEFNFAALDKETSAVCDDWEHLSAAYLSKERNSSHDVNIDFNTKVYVKGSWLETPESKEYFIHKVKNKIVSNYIPTGFRNSDLDPSSVQVVVDKKAISIDPKSSDNNPVESNFFESSGIGLDLNSGTFDFSIYGTILIVIGFLIGTLLYKIKGAPFHIWAPTIYTRMPTASLVVLMTLFTFIFSLYFFQLFLNIFYLYGNIIAQLFLISGLLSLIFGFLGAFDQKLLKKFFVYSSIGHVAFLLFTFTFFSSIKSELSLLMYLMIYLISTFLLWYLITFNSQKIEFLSNLLKPIKNNTLFIFIFIVITFSMSGIPPLAGFYIKFDVLNLLAFSQEFFILFTSLLITVASFYYYLRLLKIANFENFSTSLLQILNVEQSWSFLRLFFLFVSTFLLFLFSVVIEQSFYYFNSYLF